MQKSLIPVETSSMVMDMRKDIFRSMIEKQAGLRFSMTSYHFEDSDGIELNAPYHNIFFTVNMFI